MLFRENMVLVLNKNDQNKKNEMMNEQKNLQGELIKATYIL